MKKISLIALAVPALFAACSQEDIVSDVQNQSGEMLGKVAGDVTFVYDNTPETRMTWAPDGDAETAIKWNATEGDAFSLFWLGTTPGTPAYKGVTNALYKSTDGAEFKSENIIYQGNHVIVYPANYAHTTETKIVVSVPATQNAADDLGTKRTVAVSDLLTIKAPITTWSGDKSPEAQMAEQPNVIWGDGYNASLNHGSARVNVLSSHMVLNLNFDLKKLEEVEVRNIKLVADKDVFATSGNLVNSDGFISLSPTNCVNTVTLNANNAVVTKEKNSYKAQISLLPPEKKLVDANYSIVVETNYGLITIDKALDVTNNAGKAQFKPFNAVDAEGKEIKDNEGNYVAGEANATTPLSFYTEFLNIATRNADDPATANVDESEESYGQRIIRNVNVDMSKASIKNWPVKSSPELIAAYEIYDNLDRDASEATREETFVMSPTWGPCFELTPEAAEWIEKHPYVKLNHTSDLTEIKLVTGSNKSFDKIPSLTTIQDKKNLMLLVMNGNTWTLNVEDAALANQWKHVDNQATLTVIDENVDTDDYTGEDLAVELITGNGGQTTFNLHYPLTVKYTENFGCKTVVPEGYTLALEGDGNVFKGTLEVEGRVIINRNLTTLNGTTNVYGSLLTAGDGTLVNKGTVWIKDDAASAIVSENYNTIELKSRNNSAVVNGKNKGYIKWTNTAQELARTATDAFNYVRLSSDVTLTSQAIEQDGTEPVGHIKYLEITGNKVKITSSDASAAQVVDEIVIGTNNTMLVPIGTRLNTAKVSGGFVEVYGDFSYSQKNGTVIYDLAQTTEASLRALIAAGGEIRLKNNVTLTDDLIISGDVTLNLDGKTLTTASYGIDKVSGNLTIKGGSISTTGAMAVRSWSGSLNLINCNVTAAKTVVKVKGGTATITGGEYSNTNTDGSTYCIGVESNAVVTINTTINKNKQGNGGLSVQNATVNITGGSYYGNTNIYQSGLHAGNGAEVTYSDNVNFDTFYIQTKVEPDGDALNATTVNGAKFNTENTEGTGFRGSKEELNTKIESIKNPSADDAE